jgi:hypothetical protein
MILSQSGGVFQNEFSTFCNKYGIIYRGRHYNHTNLMGLPKERTTTELDNAMLETVRLPKELWVRLF